MVLSYGSDVEKPEYSLDRLGKAAMTDVSVVICTYNGEPRLPQVLDRLRSQVQTADFSWDVWVVDNNSTDGTADLVRQYQANWPSTFPLRYAFEPRQGIAYARRCAVEQTQSPLLAFLDDDNWPATNWVAAAYRFSQAHPQAGAFGSQLCPAYEVPPPPDFNAIACCLALMTPGTESYRYLPEKWRFPAGAGLVLRREAWLASVPSVPRLAGVKGNGLATKGEDVETLTYISQKGWEIWHNAAMQVDHYIPAKRLDVVYLRSLFRGIGLSRYPTRRVRYGLLQWLLLMPLYWLNDGRQLLLHWLRHGHLRHSAPGQISVDCQRTLLSYSLISPMYHWHLGIQRLLSRTNP